MANQNVTLPTTSSVSVVDYIHQLSGQKKPFNIVEKEHSYCKNWNRHPDPNVKSRPARFLFMEFSPSFCSNYRQEEEIDVVGNECEMVDVNPFVLESNSNNINNNNADFNEESPFIEKVPNKSQWTPILHFLWSRAIKILYSDRLSRLAAVGSPDEIIIKQVLGSQCANKFRHLASSTSWDVKLLSWLHKTLCDYVSPFFLTSYHEAMQILRQKIPTIVDKFYVPPKVDLGTRNRMAPDPIQSVLINHKPKRIFGSPLFLLVPCGPQMPHALTSRRMKHWHNMFGSLGKIITPTVVYQPQSRVSDCLNNIRVAIREKISECRTTFNEGRPLVLVGFGYSSLIAAHCALDNSSQVAATVCLGFPIIGINGFRGDLDDPLLETEVPTLFVIGQNSSLCTIDDMEDFRERLTKTETGLVVVGGANDQLSMSCTKQRFSRVTQTLVDRCIADEIYDFVSSVINPNYISNENTPRSRSNSNSNVNKKSKSVLKEKRPKDKLNPLERRKILAKDRRRRKTKTEPKDNKDKEPTVNKEEQQLTEVSVALPAE